MAQFFSCQGFLCLLLIVFVGVEFVSGQPPGSKLEVEVEGHRFELDHRDSLFGQPPYGASFNQTVYYVEDNLCGFAPVVNTSTWKAPYVVMVSRGGCTFVKKVRNAQLLGAAAVVIADNHCLCSDANCVSEDICESTEPIMADDGSGADISIPSMLIFKSDADPLIQELKNGTHISMIMSFELPSPDDRVEYDWFTSPTDKMSKEFLTSWKPMATALDTHGYFRPHMYIYDGVKSNCVSNSGEDMCFNLCTNGGRYCQTDPDNDLEKGISGADVVTESLRRICIWMHYGRDDGIGEPFWDYVNDFEMRCDTPDYFTNVDCINDSYKHASVDGDKIDQCMTDSGGLDENRPNTLLEQAIADQSSMGVVVIPTVFVNTAALRGKLSADSVFGAICSGFADGSAPDVCACASCEMDLTTCVEYNSCHPSTTVGSGGTITSGSNTIGGGSTNGNSYGGNNGSSQSGSGSNLGGGGNGASGNNTSGDGLSNFNGNSSNGGSIPTGNTTVGSSTTEQDTNMSEGSGGSSFSNGGVISSETGSGGSTNSGQGSSMSGGGSSGLGPNGWSDWESEAPANNNPNESMMAGLLMLSDLFESFGGGEVCGINFEEIANAASSGSDPTDQLLDSIHLDEKCTSSQEEEFIGTLERFESCSGWDIQEVIETFPSAMVGTAMRCVMKAMTLDQNDEAFEETIITECAGVILDDNPLGNFFKRMLLEPGKNCECLGILSEVPECQLDVWPIPIFGSGFHTWSCLLTSFGCPFLDSLCDMELMAMKSCLPHTLPDGSYDEKLCDNAFRNCEDNSVLMSLPLRLSGMPFPDACSQKREVYGNTMNSYETYVKYCVEDTGFWELHERPSNYADHSKSLPDEMIVPEEAEEEEATAAPTADEALAATKQEDIMLEKEEEEDVNEIPSPANVLEKRTISKESKSSSSSGFLNGLITGAILSATVLISAAFYHKKHSSGRNGPPGEGNDQRGLYNTIELT